MKRLEVAKITDVYKVLDTARDDIGIYAFGIIEVPESHYDLRLQVVTAVDECLPDLPVSETFKKKFGRLRVRLLDRARDPNLRTLIDECLHDLRSELEEPVFFYVPAHHREYLDQDRPLFGQKVADRFPDAARDIASAARCLALDEWTASVFHSMRVLEVGLREIAQRFGVPFVVEGWHTVIKGIEDALKVLRNKPGLTEQDRKEIEHYSEAATEFRHFKDAWRNHVTHAKEHYDEKDADRVWRSVCSFMQKIAEDL